MMRRSAHPARGPARASTRTARIGGSVFTAAAASLVASLLLSGHLHIPAVGHRTAALPPVVLPLGNVIHVRWRAQDMAPAPNAGRICVTDSNRGRICAAYVVGE